MSADTTESSDNKNEGPAVPMMATTHLLPHRKPKNFADRLMRTLLNGIGNDSLWWVGDGKAVGILPKNLKRGNLLTDHFNIKNYNAFIRNCNRWGFHRTNQYDVPDGVKVYQCSLFRRDAPHLMLHMRMDSDVQDVFMRQVNMEHDDEDQQARKKRRTTSYKKDEPAKRSAAAGGSSLMMRDDDVSYASSMVSGSVPAGAPAPAASCDGSQVEKMSAQQRGTGGQGAHPQVCGDPARLPPAGDPASGTSGMMGQNNTGGIPPIVQVFDAASSQGSMSQAQQQQGNNPGSNQTNNQGLLRAHPQSVVQQQQQQQGLPPHQGSMATGNDRAPIQNDTGSMLLEGLVRILGSASSSSSSSASNTMKQETTEHTSMLNRIAQLSSQYLNHPHLPSDSFADTAINALLKLLLSNIKTLQEKHAEQERQQQLQSSAVANALAPKLQEILSRLHQQSGGDSSSSAAAAATATTQTAVTQPLAQQQQQQQGHPIRRQVSLNNNNNVAATMTTTTTAPGLAVAVAPTTQIMQMSYPGQQQDNPHCVSEGSVSPFQPPGPQTAQQGMVRTGLSPAVSVAANIQQGNNRPVQAQEGSNVSLGAPLMPRQQMQAAQAPPQQGSFQNMPGRTSRPVEMQTTTHLPHQAYFNSSLQVPQSVQQQAGYNSNNVSGGPTLSQAQNHPPQGNFGNSMAGPHRAPGQMQATQQGRRTAPTGQTGNNNGGPIVPNGGAASVQGSTSQQDAITSLLQLMGRTRPGGGP